MVENVFLEEIVCCISSDLTGSLRLKRREKSGCWRGFLHLEATDLQCESKWDLKLELKKDPIKGSVVLERVLMDSKEQPRFTWKSQQTQVW